MYGTPSYQSGVTSVVGSKRGVPDLSYDADPNTGVAVSCTANPGWAQFGGTSVSSPALAGVENLNGSPYASGTNFLTELYGNLLVTGIGSPRASARCNQLC